MPRRRPLLILAMLAALVVAPSSVSGAPPNELRAAAVTPSSGWTTTPFIFSVEYHSSAGNPAQSVSASAAGIDLPLLLVSGTAVNGSWRGSRLLPAGTWAVTFSARVAKGPEPSLQYGVVTVASASAPPSAGGNGPVISADDADSGGGSSWQPAPQVTTTPRPSSEPAPETAAPPASRSVAPAPSSDRADPGASQRPRGRRDRSAEPSITPAGAAMTGGASPDQESADEPGAPPVLSLVLLIGLSAVGAVTLIGTGWVLLAARRERETAPVEAAAATEPDIAMRAIATVEQRALRRARLRQADDPILAGLGLDEETSRTAPPGSASAGRTPPRTVSPRRQPGDRPRR